MVRKKKYSKNTESVNNNIESKKGILKNKGFWGLVIIILMLGSVFSLSFFNSDNTKDSSKIEYNGYKFINNGNGWVVNYQGKEVAFEYLPNELNDINIEKPIFNLNDVQNEYFIGFIPNEYNENSYEVLRLRGLLAVKSINAFPGCLEENGCGNLPLIKCNDKTIILKNGDENKGHYENGCYIIEGKDVLKVINKFIYTIYGVV